MGLAALGTMLSRAPEVSQNVMVAQEAERKKNAWEMEQENFKLLQEEIKNNKNLKQQLYKELKMSPKYGKYMDDPLLNPSHYKDNSAYVDKVAEYVAAVEKENKEKDKELKAEKKQEEERKGVSLLESAVAGGGKRGEVLQRIAKEGTGALGLRPVQESLSRIPQEATVSPVAAENLAIKKQQRAESEEEKQKKNVEKQEKDITERIEKLTFEKRNKATAFSKLKGSQKRNAKEEHEKVIKEIKFKVKSLRSQRRNLREQLDKPLETSAILDDIWGGLA